MDIDVLATAIAKALLPIEKGWLPAGTTQGDLDDGDFAWISDDGKTRKLPFKIHGAVNEAGWRAAWDAVHGARSAMSFDGGPSKSATIAKLKANKPAGVEITEKARVDVAISKADLRHGVIYGVASSLRSDSQGDYVADDDELEAAAIRFMERQIEKAARATDTHGDTIPGAFVASWVENGQWRIGFKPADRQIAIDAANGEYVGFSMAGSVNME